MNNVASGYFNSFLGVGEAVGPISASLMTSWIDFRVAEDIVAILILTYCIAFFFFCGRISLFRQTESEAEDDMFEKVIERKKNI